ncbi:Rv3654c family TadE-like protein [Ornithinimicrobium sp. LYQ103]|uniref:Rv3654c family TadE-like protein n=1 Tax=Ornithinimicrobium sp. LYQ103 TaxID=3378796 RepID=UPI0038534AC4
MPTPDRGSGTVLALGLLGVLGTLLLAGVLVVAVSVGGQHARTAADLAALAGAGRAVWGVSQVEVCGVAAQVAHQNGGLLTSCEVSFGHDSSPVPRVDVEVVTQVAGRWTLRATAAAGGAAAEQ